MGMIVAKQVSTPQNSGSGREDQVAHERHDALHDGQQGDADGIRTDDHVHLAHDAAAHVPVERQYLAAVAFHAQAAAQDERGLGEVEPVDLPMVTLTIPAWRESSQAPPTSRCTHCGSRHNVNRRKSR